MKIEVLYVPGCPNCQPAVERIQEVLEADSLRADIESVPVNSDAEAQAFQFPGSPTIRIDGVDVEPLQDECNRPSLVGSIRTAAVFPQRKCLGSPFRERTKGSEGACASQNE